MDAPIISPWLIYLAGIADDMKFSLCIASLAMIILGIVIVCLIYEVKDAFRNEMRLAKKLLAAGLVIFAASLIIPNTSTCYGMIAAHYATYENVDVAGEQAEDVVEYIFEKINDVTEDEK